jgi:LacI family transcriptional regulator
MPVILFNRYSCDPNVNAVCSDNIQGARQVADLFIRTGHRRMAYVAGVTNSSTNNDREKGFFERLEEHGVRDCLREQGDFFYRKSAVKPLALAMGI